MAFSKQDKERLCAHSLIGYCQSASALTDPMVEKKELKRWADGLMELAEALRQKIEQPGDRQS